MTYVDTCSWSQQQIKEKKIEKFTIRVYLKAFILSEKVLEDFFAAVLSD